MNDGRDAIVASKYNDCMQRGWHEMSEAIGPPKCIECGITLSPWEALVNEGRKMAAMAEVGE